MTTLFAGCGEETSEPPPPLEFPGTDEERIAATVVAMGAAFEAGRGDEACALMATSEQVQAAAGASRLIAGQQRFIDTVASVGPQFPEAFGEVPDDPSCAEAADAVARAIDSDESLPLLDPALWASATADLVEIIPAGEGDLDVPEAVVNDPQEGPGVVQLAEFDGLWLVTAAFFTE